MNSGSWVKDTLAVNSASPGMGISFVTMIADAARLSVARQAFCGALRGLSVRESRFVIETLLQGLFAGLLLHLVADGLRFLVVGDVAFAFLGKAIVLGNHLVVMFSGNSVVIKMDPEFFTEIRIANAAVVLNL